MAETPEIVTILDDDDGTDARQRPRNIVTAEEYASSLDDIILQFKEAVMDDQKDALLSAVDALKRRMAA